MFQSIKISVLHLFSFALILLLILLSGCSKDSFSNLDELLDRDTVSTLKVTVTGALSRPIEKANVNTGLTGLMTDYLGQAKFQNLEKGEKIISISASGYEPVIKKVLLDNGMDSSITIEMTKSSKIINMSSYFPLDTKKSWNYSDTSSPPLTSTMSITSSSYLNNSRVWHLEIDGYKSLSISTGSIFLITGNQDGLFKKGSEIIGYNNSTLGQKILSVYEDALENIHRVTWEIELTGETISTDAGIFKDCIVLKRSELIEGSNIYTTARIEKLWFAINTGIVMTKNFSEKGVDPIFPENSKITFYQ